MNEAHKALEGVIDTLDIEFAARIHSVLYKVSYQTKETLEAMAKRLMPPLDYFDDVQVEQLGRLYLWNILGEYAKRNVAIVTTRYRTGDAVGIDGFNDSQQEQIMEWFGPQSNWQGGRLAPIANIWVALAIWNVPRNQKSTGGSIFGIRLALVRPKRIIGLKLRWKWATSGTAPRAGSWQAPRRDMDAAIDRKISRERCFLRI